MKKGDFGGEGGFGVREVTDFIRKEIENTTTRRE